MSRSQLVNADPGALLFDLEPEKPGFLRAVWRSHRTAITRSVAVVLFLGVWQWAVASGSINKLFLSSPSAIAERLYEVFADGSIWVNIFASGEVALWGFVLSIVVGVPIGMLMGRMRLARDTLEPFIMAQYSSPIVAFLPLLIIWLGIGVASKVALVFLGGVFVVIINTEAGVANVDRRLIETARSFTASELQILWKVVLPSALPFIIASMRLSIGRILIMVVVAELYAATAGLGYLIFQAGASYDTTMIFVGVTLLAGAGITLNSLLRALERRIAPWMTQNE
jgi:NitT/TauT family transport system permease protein